MVISQNSTIADFSVNFCGKEISDNTQSLLTEYVAELFDVINIPAQLTRIEIEKQDYIKHGFVCAKWYRENYILPHAVTLKALGLLGKALLSEFPNDWQEKITLLSDLKIFDRCSEHWIDRCC